jgi:hypothetical protein
MNADLQGAEGEKPASNHAGLVLRDAVRRPSGGTTPRDEGELMQMPPTGTMTMDTTTPAETPAPATPSRWARIVLLVFAVINIWMAFSDVGGVVMNIVENSNPALSWLLWSGVPIRFLLSVAALIYAAKDNVPRAIMALALLPLLDLLTDALPSLLKEGVESALADIAAAGPHGMIVLFLVVVLPAMALGAIMLARRNQRLGLATFLAILPTIFGAALVVAFGISVMIYGF